MARRPVLVALRAGQEAHRIDAPSDCLVGLGDPLDVPLFSACEDGGEDEVGRLLIADVRSVRRGLYAPGMLSVVPTVVGPVAGSEASGLAVPSVEELIDELATLAAHLSAGMCRWLELVREFDSRGKWASWGHASCAEWLSWRCRGELAYAKVRALTRVTAPARESELLELASVLTAAQLERSLGAYRRATTEDARDVQEHERLQWDWDDDGSLVVRGRLAPEDGALFLRALEAGRERPWQAGGEDGRGSAEPRPRRPTNVEAFVALADAALTGDPAERTGGDRYQVVVHVDEAVLAMDGDEAVSSGTGRRLPPRPREGCPAMPRS